MRLHERARALPVMLFERIEDGDVLLIRGLPADVTFAVFQALEARPMCVDGVDQAVEIRPWTLRPHHVMERQIAPPPFGVSVRSEMFDGLASVSRSRRVKRSLELQEVVAR